MESGSRHELLLNDDLQGLLVYVGTARPRTITANPPPRSLPPSAQKKLPRPATPQLNPSLSMAKPDL